MSTHGILADAVLDVLPDNVLVTDLDGRIVQANTRARRSLVLGDGPWTVNLSELFPFRDPDLGPPGSGHDDESPFEDIARSLDGREFRVLSRMGQGIPGRQVWMFSDLTREQDDRQGMIDYMADLTMAQAKIRDYSRQIEVFRQIVDGMDQGIVLTDADQRVGFSNSYANQLFGLELTGRRVADLKALLQAVGSDSIPELLKGEVLVLDEEKGRQTRCFLNVAPLSRTDPTNHHMVWTFFELTEEIANTQAFIDFSTELAVLNRDLRKKNEEILHLSRTDALTGVANRRTILEILEKARTFDGQAQGLTVFLIRVEGIREVNHEWGHFAGDAVLRQVCTLALAYLGDRASLGRFGGAEFLVVVPGLDEAGARALGEGLQAAVLDGTEVRGQSIRLALASVRHRPDQDLDTLLKGLTSEL